MGRHSIRLLYAILLTALFASCQRVINIDVQDTSSQLVIEGNVTNVSGSQIVSLSTTVPYSNSNIYPPVSGAAVTVSTSDGQVYIFKETSAGQYTYNFLKTKAGGAYTLNVIVSGKVYQGGSIMPALVNLDSLTLSSLLLGNKVIKTVTAHYKDPAGIQNQYRFIMYVNGVQIKQIFPLDDSGSDGRLISTLLYQSDVDLVKGDKVDIEMQCIDQNMYNYWLALSQQGGNGPARSATPSNPVSNLTNGALGYFSAHTTQKKTIYIP